MAEGFGQLTFRIGVPRGRQALLSRLTLNINSSGRSSGLHTVSHDQRFYRGIQRRSEYSFRLAQLSLLAEDFVFFRRLTNREGSSIQESGPKSACRGMCCNFVVEPWVESEVMRILGIFLHAGGKRH
jgi:hypothetical protein